MSLLSFDIDAIEEFYTEPTSTYPRPRITFALPSRAAGAEPEPEPESEPAINSGERVYFLIRGAWHDGIVTECESYDDISDPYAAVQEDGFKLTSHWLAVDKLFSIEEVLDQDPDYNAWLHELDRADMEE